MTSKFDDMTHEECEALARKNAALNYPKVLSLLDGMEGLERSSMLSAMFVVSGEALYKEEGKDVFDIVLSRLLQEMGR